MTADPRLLEHLCPLCGSNRAHVTYVMGRNGRPFYLPMFSCAGCTVVFTDIERFKRLMQRIETPAQPGSPYGHTEEKPLVAGLPPIEPRWKPPD